MNEKLPLITDNDVPSYHRGKRGAFSRWLGRSILRLMGWEVEGVFPQQRKLIIVAAPHTSNWDFVFGMAAILALNLHCNWMGKHTIFRKPFAGMMRWLGGIPVYRERPEGIAEQMAGHIKNADAMLLVITPEGTRSKVENWKTGFLRISSAAECDILLASLDFAKKRIRVGDVFSTSNDVEQDVTRVREYFSQFTPRHPDRF